MGRSRTGGVWRASEESMRSSEPMRAGVRSGVAGLAHARSRGVRRPPGSEQDGSLKRVAGYRHLSI